MQQRISPQKYQQLKKNKDAGMDDMDYQLVIEDAFRLEPNDGDDL